MRTLDQRQLKLLELVVRKKQRGFPLAEPIATEMIALLKKDDAELVAELDSFETECRVETQNKLDQARIALANAEAQVVSLEADQAVIGVPDVVPEEPADEEIVP